MKASNVQGNSPHKNMGVGQECNKRAQTTRNQQAKDGTKLQFSKTNTLTLRAAVDVPSAHLLRKDTLQPSRRRLLSDFFWIDGELPGHL